MQRCRDRAGAAAGKRQWLARPAAPSPLIAASKGSECLASCPLNGGRGRAENAVKFPKCIISDFLPLYFRPVPRRASAPISVANHSNAITGAIQAAAGTPQRLLCITPSWLAWQPGPVKASAAAVLRKIRLSAADVPERATRRANDILPRRIAIAASCATAATDQWQSRAEARQQRAERSCPATLPPARTRALAGAAH